MGLASMVNAIRMLSLALVLCATPLLAQDAGPLDPRLVPHDAGLAIFARPAQLLQKQPALSKLADLVMSGEGVQKFNLRADQIDTTGVVMHPFADPMWEAPPETMVILWRTIAPHDWKTASAAGLENLVEFKPDPNFDIDEYFENENAEWPGELSYYVLDDRTIAIGGTTLMHWMVDRYQKNDGERAWHRLWDRVSGGQVVILGDSPFWNEKLKHFVDDIGVDEETMIFWMIDPLWRRTNGFAAAINASPTLNLRAYGDCFGEEDAQRVAETLRSVYTLGRNMAEAAIRKMTEDPDVQTQAIGGAIWLGMLKTLLNGLEITHDQSLVTVKYDLPIDAGWLMTLVTPMIDDARNQARRTQEMNYVRQVLLAMHNYAAVHGKFPPAVIRNPGQQPYSWRVALLPYLEQQNLYDQYKFDEPWDSPANLKIAEVAVPFYCSEDGNSNASTIYLVTGKNTAFEPDGRGVGFAQIRDGMSNTAMLVQTKRDIPWSKPEDIELPATDEIPQFGGVVEGGYIVGMFDGSTWFVDAPMNDATVRAMFSPSGGEAIQLPWQDEAEFQFEEDFR
jgi:hypothetical protein